jgi:hypothetical protein
VMTAIYFVQPLIPILVIAGIVAAVMARKKENGLDSPDELDIGIGRAKRAYFYGITSLYMLVAGAGIALVARYFLDELFGPPLLSRGTEQLSVGVALALIWTPIWVWHRLQVQRFAREEPAECRSLLRKLYVYMTLGVTAALAAQALIDLLRWTLGAKSFSGYALAAVAVWGALWAFYWLAEVVEGQPTEQTRTIRCLYVYVASAAGLTMLAAAAGFAIYLVLKQAYDGQFPVTLLVRGEEGLWSEAMKNCLSVAVVGAGLWSFHWLYLARRAGESSIRGFFLHSIATLAGGITVLSAAGVIVFGVLQWSIGTPDDLSASAHFRFLPGAVSALVVGLGLWLYHWAVIQRDHAASGRTEASGQTYAYVMAALGLGALVAAIMTLVPTAVGIVVDSATDVLVGADWWRDRIVLVITLGLLGAPVWSYHWFSAQRLLASEEPTERTNVSRRVLVYGVVIVGSLACLGSLSYLLFLVLNAVLEDNVSLTLLSDARWSMGVIGASGLVVPYYWLVLREDRRAQPQPAARPLARQKSVTVLMPEDGTVLLAQIERALGGKVRVLHRLNRSEAISELSAGDLRVIARQVSQATGSRVLLLVEASGVQVYAYR